jgi:hypothetical protein
LSLPLSLIGLELDVSSAPHENRRVETIIAATSVSLDILYIYCLISNFKVGVQK